ncbi:MAG TPA: phosphoglucomutase (alpha-D-glucose-1,6-bisphosphate-dependent) [Acidimicrobiales bacterium]|nr:phosphoglucomutase (alpha-D-glucose-1,6-bisphosphate-dependent) [Acidimicrobiales bacterium]
MAVSEKAGKPAEPGELVDVDALVRAYYDDQPDASEPSQQVSFGTSGHRGSALERSFNEAHILATTQAICDYRAEQGTDGPLFLGRDTHALSEPAFRTAVEVLVGNEVEVIVDADERFTPTPVISHAILTHNRTGGGGDADGIVVTPSHNPPEDGGFKYNPHHGGPASSSVTGWIEDRANELLAGGLDGVRRVPYDKAGGSGAVRRHDYTAAYVDDLAAVVDVDAIRAAGVRLGVDPLGGASVDFWAAIGERLKLDLTVVNDAVDPTFGFMTLDSDGRIRMDCSSPYAMRRLIDVKDKFDLSFGNDPDADRHGVVTPESGLLDPNHYLAVAVDYLFGSRHEWPADAAVGKTVVSSSMIDRVADGLGRRLFEVPVGFKWFVDGLTDGALGFGGEESAGASFLRRDGSVWTTDKDGIVLCLAAAELLATTGEGPDERYRGLTERYGRTSYRRVDAPASAEQKAALKKLSPDQVELDSLAGDPVVAMHTEAPGDGNSIGGLKVVSEGGWFAARPSGTEDVYKLYAESFRGDDHLARIIEEAQAVVDKAIGA